MYEDKYGRSLAKTIMRKFSGDLEDALLALLYDPIENHARALKKAFRGFGTDEVSQGLSVVPPNAAREPTRDMVMSTTFK